MNEPQPETADVRYEYELILEPFEVTLARRELEETR